MKTTEKIDFEIEQFDLYQLDLLRAKIDERIIELKTLRTRELVHKLELGGGTFEYNGHVYYVKGDSDE